MLFTNQSLLELFRLTLFHTQNYTIIQILYFSSETSSIERERDKIVLSYINRVPGKCLPQLLVHLIVWNSIINNIKTVFCDLLALRFDVFVRNWIQIDTFKRRLYLQGFRTQQLLVSQVLIGYFVDIVNFRLLSWHFVYVLVYCLLVGWQFVIHR